MHVEMNSRIKCKDLWTAGEKYELVKVESMFKIFMK